MHIDYTRIAGGLAPHVVSAPFSLGLISGIGLGVVTLILAI